MNSEELTTQVMRNLVEGIQGGNAAASDELLRRCAYRLEALARKMLRRYFPQGRPLEDTCDILQSASLRMLRTLHTIQPNDTRHFFNLAALQIRQVLLDMLRSCKSRHRFRHVTLLSDDSEAGLGAADPASEADPDLDVWEAFHEAIDRLPAEEREVVSLRFYHGWTQTQIAELMSVDERTIRRYWRRACLTLSDSLRGQLPDLT